jgi:hypothetical protein
MRLEYLAQPCLSSLFPGTSITFSIWVLVSLINSCYTSTWDIKMDWGLMQRNSQYRFLRDEIVFHRWVSPISSFSFVVTPLFFKGVLHCSTCQCPTPVFMVDDVLPSRHKWRDIGIHDCIFGRNSTYPVECVSA